MCFYRFEKLRCWFTDTGHCLVDQRTSSAECLQINRQRGRFAARAASTEDGTVDVDGIVKDLQDKVFTVLCSGYLVRVTGRLSDCWAIFRQRLACPVRKTCRQWVDGRLLQWDRVENKTTVAVYAGGAVVALWLSSTIVGAVNAVPLVSNTCLCDPEGWSFGIELSI